jgi:hypothetical protein
LPEPEVFEVFADPLSLLRSADASNGVTETAFGGAETDVFEGAAVLAKVGIIDTLPP